jgi:hypothetical protein
VLCVHVCVSVHTFRRRADAHSRLALSLYRLPHTHILLVLDRSDHPQTPEAFDSMVQARIPSAATHPELRKLVLKHHVHRPCGPANPKASCMRDGRCRFKYPKDHCDETALNLNHYPDYARPEHHAHRGAVREDHHHEPRHLAVQSVAAAQIPLPPKVRGGRARARRARLHSHTHTHARAASKCVPRSRCVCVCACACACVCEPSTRLPLLLTRGSLFFVGGEVHVQVRVQG